MLKDLETIVRIIRQRYIGQNATVLRVLSQTNNTICEIEHRGRICVAKLVKDNDIDIGVMTSTMDSLRNSVHVPQIHDVINDEGGGGQTVLLMELVPGESLDRVLVRNDTNAGAALADVMIACLRVAASLPDLPFSEPGIYKRKAASFNTWKDFSSHYFARYYNRVAPRIENESFRSYLFTWADDIIANTTRSDKASLQTVPIDLNLRNFIWDGSKITVLNIPILGRSVPEHGQAAAAVQLRGFHAYELLMDRMKVDLGFGDPDLLNYYEVWILVGILSFYAQKLPPIRIEDSCNWGASITLMSNIMALTEWSPALDGKAKEAW
jgi:hypothetical protein